MIWFVVENWPPVTHTRSIVMLEKRRVCLLPKDEGSIIICYDTIQPYKWETILNTTLCSAKLLHGGDHVNDGMVGYYCGGEISVILISESKQALHCARCGFRQTIPHYVVSVGQLETMKWA